MKAQPSADMVPTYDMTFEFRSMLSPGSTTPVGTGALFVIDDAIASQSGLYSCLAQSCRSNDKTVYSDFVEVKSFSNFSYPYLHAQQSTVPIFS